MKKTFSAFFKKIDISAIFLFAGLSFLFTYPLFLKMFSGIYGNFFDTDLRGSVWSLWWLKYAFTHHLNERFCTFIAAPFGAPVLPVFDFWISYHSRWHPKLLFAISPRRRLLDR